MSAQAIVLTRPEAVFRARGLTKVYRMGEVEVQALRSVDLDLYRGGLMVLLGASGSGKSTLLNMLGGLDTPTSGEVHYRDRDPTAADERRHHAQRRHRRQGRPRGAHAQRAGRRIRRNAMKKAPAELSW